MRDGGGVLSIRSQTTCDRLRGKSDLAKSFDRIRGCNYGNLSVALQDSAAKDSNSRKNGALRHTQFSMKHSVKTCMTMLSENQFANSDCQPPHPPLPPPNHLAVCRPLWHWSHYLLVDGLTVYPPTLTFAFGLVKQFTHKERKTLHVTCVLWKCANINSATGWNLISVGEAFFFFFFWELYYVKYFCLV